MSDDGSERIDPRDLPTGFDPAYVELRDQLVYVADATLLDSGWLKFTEWPGDEGLLPPQQCGKVKFVATETDGETYQRRVADPDRRRQALPDPQEVDL